MKWFDEDEVNKIMNGIETEELTEHFNNEESVKALPEKCSFSKPEGWEEGI